MKTNNRPKEKHWYYLGETIYNSGRVMSACGQLVHRRDDCDLREPTCRICKEHQMKFESLEIG